jgi:hypothetical protein
MTAPQPQDAAPKPCPLCQEEMKSHGNDWLGHAPGSLCMLKYEGLHDYLDILAWNDRIAAWNRRALAEKEKQP